MLVLCGFLSLLVDTISKVILQRRYKGYSLVHWLKVDILKDIGKVLKVEILF